VKDDRHSLHLNRSGFFESRSENVTLKVGIKLVLLHQSFKGSERVWDVGSIDFDLQMATEQCQLFLALESSHLNIILVTVFVASAFIIRLVRFVAFVCLIFSAALATIIFVLAVATACYLQRS
jgi:hypothetical protein